MEWELSNPQVFWTDNAAHHNLAWWRWDFLFTSGEKETNKVWGGGEKGERRWSRKYIFEQQLPVVYLMIASLLLNHDVLIKSKCPDQCDSSAALLK